MAQNEKINRSKEKPLILVSPLDWGLGHTTRCIPLIRELLASGASVIVACNSTQKALLLPEFPEISFVHLDGYGLRYGANGLFTFLLITLQAPKILIKIKKENQFLRHFLAKTPVQAIIADNRYGVFSPSVPSIFITHQLFIQTGVSLIDRMVRWFNYRFISSFSECWVPDFKNAPDAAGKLSHPPSLPSIPTHYIGCLSRFVYKPIQIRYTRVILISGPEPQRSIFENRVLSQLEGLPGKTLVVRGLPGNHDSLPQTEQTAIINHAGAEELNELINSSALVISRSGYTTIMDMLKLKKRMILIPTPGQQEQQYLAQYLASKQLALSFNQETFSIAEAEKQARDFQFRLLEENMEGYKETVQRLVQSVTMS